jgi:hypothetical protein
MAQIDWRFMQPLDQSNQIAAMASGNQQINAGLAAMGNAVTGYADAIKQRNTDSILNALYQAQTSADLPNALSAVQALQQQYGRGYDQAAVRNAIDTRGSTLSERDLQAINLQQAQAAQAALPQLQALNVERMRAAGAPSEQIAAAQGIQGIDTTALTNSLVNDLQDARNFKRLQQRDIQSDLESNRSYNLQLQNSAIQGAQYLAPDAGTSKQMIDANGNIINVSQPSRSDALAAGYALQGGYVDRVVGTESGGNPTAKNPKSTATGAGQFIESTWLTMMSKYRPDLTKGKTEPQILAMRNNPTLSREMTAKYAEENGAALRKANLPVNDGTLYLAHFAGPGGAQKLLKANPNASAESILGTDAANRNGNIIRGKTAGQVISWAAKQVGASGGNNTTGATVTAGISPADLTSIRTLYNKDINKATADYQALTAKQNSKGSVAAGSTGVDTWLANKKEFSLFGGSTNPISTDAHDLLKMAKEDKDWNNLPETAKVNILESAYGFVNSTGLTEYVPNQSVRNFINNRTKEYRANEVNTYKNNKDAAFNTAYTALQEKFQLAGATPPTVEQARLLLGITPPQQPNKQQAPKAQPVPTPTATPATQQTPTQQTATAKAPSYITSGAAIASRNNAVQEGVRRASNVANMPTQQEMQAMRSRALAQAKSKKEEAEAIKAFKKLEEERAKNHKLSAKTKALLNEFGGGILK